MASTAFTSTSGTVDNEGLLLRREGSLASSAHDHADPGAVARFYRHIYPALALDPGAPQAWLETLIQHNSGSR